ncbi:MAG: aminotransferase class III-fold pyridoxal phosphate-dependent enzyme [Gemmatimonadota bacterium]
MGQGAGWRERAADLLSRHYGIRGTVAPLPGENRNFRVSAADGRRFALKFASGECAPELCRLEAAALGRVLRSGMELGVPTPVPTLSGEGWVESEEAADDPRCTRLLEWVPGTPWAACGRPSPDLLRDLGRKLAALDRVLGGLDHPAAARTHAWNLTAAGQHRDRVCRVAEPGRRRTLERAFHLWAACAAPRLSGLPRSFIHGDANDENVLVDGDRVVGLVDFGDALVNPTVCELAIALAYAMLGREEPLEAGAEVVAGYHDVRPLAAAELEVLFPLVCGRLAVSVAVAAERRRTDPERSTWFVTEERAWPLLEVLSDVDPAAGAAALASKTGIGPSADRASGPAPEILLERRRRHVGPSLSLSYRRPLEIARGAGQYLYDRRGRPYLDLVNNVCHVGHCHPRVVEAARRQIARLNTNTRYLYAGLTEYAERLCATLPEPLEVCYFVNSGSEANELALRLARAHTGHRDFVVLEGAYHGNTSSLVALSPYKFLGRGGTGAPEPWVHVAPLPDGYRGIHRGRGREAGLAYGNEVGRVIAEAGVPIAGFLAESLPSCAGQILPPPGYLETAFRHVRRAGGLCIVDEVQTGFGRPGSRFWGFELQGVVPDVVVLGKPIGNGHPLGAVVTSREIAASFDTGMEFFSTFGGNPVSCAIGLAVLEVIEEEGLQERAERVGGRLLAGLRGLAERHAWIGEARGVGLFLGVELVRDRRTLEPAAAEATEIVERMKERGILLSTDGTCHNVLKIKPPMVLDEDDVEMTLRSLDDVLSELGG